ncbi:MAG TPA: DUF6596 domain-containing protein [Jiangellaceae bacterium]
MRLFALLTAELRSIDLAEDALADAFGAAATSWPDAGPPANPAAWLLVVGRRRAADRARREAILARKLPLLIVDTDQVDRDAAATTIPDERLRLLFTASHPALAPEARLALTLRYVAGLRTPDVARLLLVSESTMAARLTRAKHKIAQAGIPYRVPSEAELPERTSAVLAVIYLIFTEGYAAADGSSLTRPELADEAIRLALLLAELMPDEPEAEALLGLLLLQHARRDARVDDADLVRLSDQDRSRWHADEITAGIEHVRVATQHAAQVTRPDPGEGRYLLQAQIAVLHTVATSAEDTDWITIAALYLRLERLTGSPVVRVNRAVAVAEAGDVGLALALLDGLEAGLPAYPMLPAVRAELLRRLGRNPEAGREYDRALALTSNAVRRRFLAARRASLSG